MIATILSITPFTRGTVDIWHHKMIHQECGTLPDDDYSRRCPKFTFFVLQYLNTSNDIKECCEEHVPVHVYQTVDAQIWK